MKKLTALSQWNENLDNNSATCEVTVIPLAKCESLGSMQKARWVGDVKADDSVGKLEAELVNGLNFGGLCLR